MGFFPLSKALFVIHEKAGSSREILEKIILWVRTNELLFSAAGQKWLPSLQSLPRPCALLWLILLTRVKRREKKKKWVGFSEYVKAGRTEEGKQEIEWGELVQYFDNGYPWKKPNHSSGH